MFKRKNFKTMYILKKRSEEEIRALQKRKSSHEAKTKQ